MTALYLITTIGYFLGWIRLVPCIKKHKWLSCLFYIIAITTLTWGNIQITDLLSNTETNKEAFKLFISYFGYVFVLSLIFYHLVEYLKNTYDRESSLYK
ncbi:hypothetical protein [Wielerella bovis]|uniref:hypothetical protein n=1 Tax=Wielerella bovis TaxID=2917790 RepID=UPI002018C206|nr:hypothetical protein [Wielerella bovis]MCG7656142.1 hypothetical protein [Wielerella bovis]MCG7658367.1 hypothetical protein [Wielerella bovis]